MGLPNLANQVVGPYLLAELSACLRDTKRMLHRQHDQCCKLLAAAWEHPSSIDGQTPVFVWDSLFIIVDVSLPGFGFWKSVEPCWWEIFVVSCARFDACVVSISLGSGPVKPNTKWSSLAFTCAFQFMFCEKGYGCCPCSSIILYQLGLLIICQNTPATFSSAMKRAVCNTFRRPSKAFQRP